MNTRAPRSRDEEAILHLAAGRHSAASLARALGISRITAFRMIQRLRGRGLRILSMKRGREWYFEVQEGAPDWESDPLALRIGFARSRRLPGESVDDALYGRDS